MSQPLIPLEDWTDGLTQPNVVANDNARRTEVIGLPAASFESVEPTPVEGTLYVLSAAWGDGVEHDFAYYLDGAFTYWTPFEGQVKEIGGTTYRLESGAWAVYSAAAVATVAIQYTADLGSIADADPGAGLLVWNNATQASATELYLDDDSSDGVTLTGIWGALSAGGFLYLQHATDQDLWQIWDVTGVVDATGYAKLAVTLLAKSAANFADADPMFVTIQQGATSTGLADGDYGDITVSGSGAALTIDNGVVTLAKMADMATASLLGRNTAGTGAPEVLSASTARTLLGGTTVGQALFTGTNPGAITFVRINADNSVTFRSSADFRTDLGLGAGSANAWTTGQTMPDLNISDAAGTNRDLNWQSAGVSRWRMRCNTTEDFIWTALDAAGVSLGNVLSVPNATQIASFNQSPLVPTATAGDDTTKAASTAFVWGASATIRQNSQSAAYTLVAADAGKHILHPSADTTARIFTIPANASVAFPIGTAVTFINQNAGGVITISITTDTMRLAGAGTTGSRTLAANGVATAIKITTTEWIISGTGLT